jgi:hypothetical protein
MGGASSTHGIDVKVFKILVLKREANKPFG